MSRASCLTPEKKTISPEIHSRSMLISVVGMCEEDERKINVALNAATIIGGPTFNNLIIIKAMTIGCMITAPALQIIGVSSRAVPTSRIC